MSACLLDGTLYFYYYNLLSWRMGSDEYSEVKYCEGDGRSKVFDALRALTMVS